MFCFAICRRRPVFANTECIVNYSDIVEFKQHVCSGYRVDDQGCEIEKAGSLSRLPAFVFYSEIRRFLAFLPAESGEADEAAAEKQQGGWFGDRSGYFDQQVLATCTDRIVNIQNTLIGVITQ